MGVFFSQEEIESLTVMDGDWPAGAPAWLHRREQPIYLYGCGVWGKLLLSFLRQNPLLGERVRGFLDNNPRLIGGSAAGLPVFSPDTPRREGLKPLVLLCTDSSVFLHEMLGDCKRLGYECGLLDKVRLECFYGVWKPNLFEDDPAPAAALAVWADAASKRTYRKLIRVRATCDNADLPRPASWRQYFHPFIPGKHYRHYVDCGAYDGDTLKQFMTFTANDFDCYHAFEPSSMKLPALTRIAGTDPRIRVHPCAVADRPGAVRFTPEDARAMAGRVVADRDVDPASFPFGMEQIAAESIDHLLGGERVTFIKMDIEGVELSALKGAESTIRRQRPALAICIYHNVRDLWEIPLWIHGLGLDYRLYCAHHGLNGCESVCYAVPE
jgi:FkbM family methyltransferase